MDKSKKTQVMRQYLQRIEEQLTALDQEDLEKQKTEIEELKTKLDLFGESLEELKRAII